MTHTKEPWRVHLLDRRTMIASDVENGYLAETRHIHSGDIEQDNAKRIVACVNACVGITDEALDKGIIKCAVENLVANLPYDDGNFYFDGVKVWEDK